MELIKQFLRDESGQDLAEYALLLALIALAAVSSMGSFGTTLAGYWASIQGEVDTSFGS